MINDNQKNRYIRNIVLPEIGEIGQEKIFDSSVLVIGAGGLGSSILFYLASAGVGKIGIVDNDIVEISNLQRQIIHFEKDLGRSKVVSAKEKIFYLNSETKVEIFQLRVDKNNLLELCKNYSIIVDATDNFASRFVINEVCHHANKTLVFGAVKGFLGQLSIFKSYENKNPCYACFNDNFFDSNQELPISEKGILGAVAGSVGSMQAINVIKEIVNIKNDLVGKILIFDYLRNNFRKVNLFKNPFCKICSIKK